MTLELRSPKHPFYTGQRKPNRKSKDDPDCWELYRLKHPEYSVDKEESLTDIPNFLDKTKEAK